VLRVAGEYQRGGRLDDSKRLLDRALGAAEPDALHRAGVVAHRRGDPVDALALMERALAHGIDTPLDLRNICEIYRTSAAWTRRWRPPAAPPR
jgi:hypothetical protein